MKNVLVLVMAVALVAAAQANVLTNPNFDLDINGDPFAVTDGTVNYDWALVQAWEGTAGEYVTGGSGHPTSPMMAKLGTWGNPWGFYTRQDSGVIALANTQYVFSVDMSDNSSYRNALAIQTVEAGVWGAAGVVDSGSIDTSSTWASYSLVLDTALNPEFVGKSLGVKAYQKDGDGGYLYITNASLEVVPEPATMALLGLGALVLRRKK